MIRAVLAGWIRDDCVVDDASLVLAAAVRAPHRGFLCACLDGGRVALLCSNGRLVTDDPEEVLRAVLLSGGGASESAIDSIGDVLRLLGERSAARATLIGISRAATAVSEARRLLLHRISRIMAAARPHVRARLARVIDEAHAAAIAPLGVAAEAELFRLASLSGCSDEEWLGRLIEFVRTCKGEPEGSGTRGGAGHDRVIAVIVFDGKSPVNALARATER